MQGGKWGGEGEGEGRGEATGGRDRGVTRMTQRRRAPKSDAGVREQA